MIRQRALAWAAILALLATVQIAPLPLPSRFSASIAALAQGDSGAVGEEPTDLAIVALHCAEAPDTEALTSYFTSATLPARCAPAVGVAIAVTENGDPVPGSPFTTDVAGTLAVPVGLGSAVEVRENPKSLPAGYEPLTQEANGVSYANPVQFGSAIAGAAALFVNLPGSAATELAQGASGAEAGESTDLAVVALQCAAAPVTEALTSFFSGGAHPSGCAPAVGVTIDVTENEESLFGSPFQTDTAGTVAVRVGVGSAVTVKEDPSSLSSGYEPLTQEVNGVPYANPVRLDPAVAGAAVLFVNVPASVAATLTRVPAAADAGEATDLTHAATLDRTGCDPAYPDERTCIAPGRPLAESCSITDQRNFTVLPPDPRRLDADGDGIGCEPSSTSGGTIIAGGSPNLYAGGGSLRRGTSASTGDRPLAVADSPIDTGAGARDVSFAGSRANWLMHRGSNRAGLWFVAPDRASAGNLAVVSNPVFIGNGLWTRPHRFRQGDWFWQNHDHDGIWFRPNHIRAGSLTIASSGSSSNTGSGNIAIVSNPIVISNGVWARPDRTHGDDWRWRNRPDNAGWFWPNRISVGNLTVATSGNDNVAIASNPVFIGNGFWRWPGHTRDDGWIWSDRDQNHHDDWMRHGRFGNGVWGWPDRIAIGNLAVARSGNGNLAVVSNPVFIGNGVWTWPNRHGQNDWFWPSTIGIGNLTIASSRNGNGNGNGNVAIVSNPVFIGRGVWHWPGHSNNRVWLWPNRIDRGHWRWPNQIGNGVWFWPGTISAGNLVIARSGGGNIAIVSNPIVISSGVWLVPRDHGHDHDWLVHRDRDHASDRLAQGGVAQTDGPDVEPLTIDSGGAGETPPDKIEPLGASEQPALTVNGELAVAPQPANSTQPSDGSVEPSPELVQPPSGGNGAMASDGYVESPGDGTDTSPPDAAVQPASDAAAPDPSYVAPDPSAIDPNYADAGNVDPGSIAPDPIADQGYVDPSYVAPEPTFVDGGSDPGYGAPEPSYVEPGIADPGYVAADPGIDPVYNAPDPGIEPGFSAPDPNFIDPGMDAGYVAPEPTYVDAGNAVPGSGMDAGYSGPDPVILPQQSTTVEPSYVDAGNANPGNPDAGNFAPDPGMDVASDVGAGNGDAGNAAPDTGGGRDERGGNDHDD